MVLFQGPAANTETILRDLESQGRSFEGDYEDYTSSSSSSWVTPETVSNMTWLLRYVADLIEDYSGLV